jgi:hypothetical protein
MTADEIVRRHFDGAPLVCEACGLIGEGRVVTTKARVYRWSHVVCQCGAILVPRVVAPPVLVPFGFQAGVPIGDLDVRGLQWLHQVAHHPWVLVPCCLRLGCHGCMVSYKEQMTRIRRMPRPTFHHPRAHRPVYQ